jgi:hypothetical protein
VPTSLLSIEVKASESGDAQVIIPSGIFFAGPPPPPPLPTNE